MALDENNSLSFFAKFPRELAAARSRVHDLCNAVRFFARTWGEEGWEWRKYKLKGMEGGLREGRNLVARNQSRYDDVAT